MIYKDENRQQFHLKNDYISYIFRVLENGHLGHLYFGPSLRHQKNFEHFQDLNNPVGYSTHTFSDNLAFSLETILQEYPLYGKGDYREPAIIVEDQNGKSISGFIFDYAEIQEGKPQLEGLPATYADSGQAETLVIHLYDSETDVKILLMYSIFERLPVITRSVQVINKGNQEVSLKRLFSCSVDLPDADYDMLHLSGAWARERHIKERPLVQGIQSIGSMRGSSSHQHNPFLVLKRKETTEHQGTAVGIQFVYSGNFLGQVEVDHYENTRIQMGIHPSQFTWGLKPGESFQAPEAIVTFSKKGLNGLSTSLHDLHRKHLIAEKWKGIERPILINNWEATYFDFNEEKLLNIVDQAKALGVELFVLDDGWFGKRNDDTSSLGDWFVNQTKLPKGIGDLADSVKKKGLAFGLWFEPEMVNPDSDLYRNHPEWVIGYPEQQLTFGRNQLVLDFSNPEVVDHIYKQMKKIIEETKLDYIKWDMNRNITEAASLSLENQGEFFHRYILGVYRLYERLLQEFPEVLFESCAGGGGRFDAGMMYYAPQAWTSDDTDSVDRLKIQYGTSLAFPLYSIGSHVSAVPNHQTWRETSLVHRGNVAYFGTFGYELDPESLTEQEKKEVREQINFYKEYRTLIRDGDFLRLLSPFRHNEVAWMVCAKDRSEALVGWYKTLSTPNPKNNQVLRLAGLKSEGRYYVSEYNRSYFGDELMYRGLPLPIEFNGVNEHMAERRGDYQSLVVHMKEIDES